MPFMKDFALDDLVGRPVMIDGCTREQLPALRALQIASGVIPDDLILVALHQMPLNVLFIIIELCLAFGAINFYAEARVMRSHIFIFQILAQNNY